MLVLSRKVGEKILVPDREVVVTVVAIEGNRVRLGITAPADVDVYREEIFWQIGQDSFVSPPGRRRRSPSAVKRSSHGAPLSHVPSDRDPAAGHGPGQD